MYFFRTLYTNSTLSMPVYIYHRLANPNSLGFLEHCSFPIPKICPSHTAYHYAHHPPNSSRRKKMLWSEGIEIQNGKAARQHVLLRNRIGKKSCNILISHRMMVYSVAPKQHRFGFKSTWECVRKEFKRRKQLGQCKCALPQRNLGIVDTMSHDIFQTPPGSLQSNAVLLPPLRLIFGRYTFREVLLSTSDTS